MQNNGIREKAVSGMMWTTIQRFIQIGIQFISGIILARLIMPEDYGVVGMLSIFMVVAQSFLDGGFGSALIQKKRPTQEDYSTVFWWNLGVSVFLYFILYKSAPLIASFYHMPILKNVLRVQSLILFISALSTIQANQLRKQFEFKKIAIISLSASIISLVVTIWMAYCGYGVWALVAQGLLMGFIPAVVYWFTCNWFPKLVFSKKSFKNLFSFGAFLFLGNLINEICNNIQGLLIGRIYNASTMGYYSKAASTEKLASTSISQSLTQIAFPLYAEYQDDKQRLIGLIKKLTGVVAFVTFPLMFVLILTAEPIFVLLYSNRWLDSVPYFQILCIAGLAVCLQAINIQAISAIGKSRTVFNWTLIKRAMGIVFIIGGLWLWGIYGLLFGMVISSWIMYLINANLVSKHIGYKMREQILDLLPIMLLAIFSFVVGWIPNFFSLSLYVNGIIEFVLFFAVYWSISHFTKMSGYKYFLELLPLIVGKIWKRK